MSFLEGLTDDQITEQAREDWRAARESRKTIEQRKLRDYRLYRRFRAELSQGGITPESKGPHGWSKLTVPLVFWVVETILPRVGIQIPTVTATARTPQAVLFAYAKQLRTQRQWELSRMEPELMLSIKSMLIMAEGVLKEFWDPVIRGPAARNVSWFDFYVSPEAANHRDAECLLHRTWHTKRGLQELMRRDADRRDSLSGKKLPRLYDHEALEQVMHGSAQRDATDETWQQVREAAGLGEVQFADAEGQFSLVELWYADGSMVTIAGDDSPFLIRAEREPIYRDPLGRSFRPFTVLSNTPDLFTPYAISSAEVLEDFQHEASTINNQAMDQATRNINAPWAYDSTMIDDVNEMDEAMGTPGGRFGVKGDPRAALYRMEAGQLSSDPERLTQFIIQQAQLASGVTDTAAGQITPGGIGNETATGAAILQQEANLRFRFLLKLLDMDLGQMAQHFDWMDREIGRRAINVPMQAGEQIPADSRGVKEIGRGFARVGPEVNAAGLDYDIDVDAGSMAPPQRGEQIFNVRSLIADLLALPPPQAGGVAIDWRELSRRVVEAHGEDPDVIFLPPGQVPLIPPVGPPGGPPQNGRANGASSPGAPFPLPTGSPAPGGGPQPI